MGTHPIFESDFDCLTVFKMRFTLPLFAFATTTLAEVDHHETHEFWVYPGGEEHTHTQSKGSFSCSFTYTANGGTNESWEMTLGVNTEGNAYSCTVGTPRGTTYLYFEDFEIKVDGATIEHTEIYGNENRRLPSGEARASGNYKFVSGSDFNH